MAKAQTLMGVIFEYSGSLDTGIVVHKRADVNIKPETVQLIRREIMARSPVLMGACRKPLVADSVGETLWTEHRISPQVMSYVVPLLVEEGYCRVSDYKPFKIFLNARR